MRSIQVPPPQRATDGFFSDFDHPSITFPAGTRLCPYDIAYCRVYGCFSSGLASYTSILDDI